jgi:transposase
LQLKERGWFQRHIATALGVTEDAVSRWLVRARNGGPESLRSRPSPGRPPKLSVAQTHLIPELLWHPAEAYGFRGEVGTCARIARVIAEQFGARYHKDPVGRLLRELHGAPHRSGARFNETRMPSGAGEMKSGRNFAVGHGASAGYWFPRTNRGSTCCPGWFGPTPRNPGPR